MCVFWLHGSSPLMDEVGLRWCGLFIFRVVPGRLGRPFSARFSFVHCSEPLGLFWSCCPQGAIPIVFPIPHEDKRNDRGEVCNQPHSAIGISPNSFPHHDPIWSQIMLRY